MNALRIFTAMCLAFPLGIFATSAGADDQEMKKEKLVTVGAQAPDFTLPANSGKDVSLSSFKDKSVVVLFFYPKDNTSVCTKEACLFRDSFDKFAEGGATVLGISSDSIESHQGFAAKHNLPFLLLSDKDGKVRKLYEVKSMAGLIPGRVTFVIDKQGVIRHSFESALDAGKHVNEAMEWVDKLVKNSPPDKTN